MEQEKYIEGLTKQIGKLNCPNCGQWGDPQQPLMAMGDYPNEFFCPHCDILCEITIIGKL